ncbi:hypothetical protein ACROYT_G003926 [Oculina patagonica]
MQEVVRVFSRGVVACQIGYDIIRVTFDNPDNFEAAKRNSGVHLFGMYCAVLGGGPPSTLVHLFDYPYEEDHDAIKDVFSDFGEVRNVRCQSYVGNPNVYTGTRFALACYGEVDGVCYQHLSNIPDISTGNHLVRIKQTEDIPRFIFIDGLRCKVWYRGQPIVCDICRKRGHTSVGCPYKGKCLLCHEAGHFARECTRACRYCRELGHQADQCPRREAYRADYPELGQNSDDESDAEGDDPEAQVNVGAGSQSLFSDEHSVISSNPEGLVDSSIPASPANVTPVYFSQDERETSLMSWILKVRKVNLSFRIVLLLGSLKILLAQVQM